MAAEVFLGERTMKHVLFVVFALFLWLIPAGAQVTAPADGPADGSTNAGNEKLLTQPTVKIATLAAETADDSSLPAAPIPHPTTTLGLSEPAPAAGSPAPPQSVYGVFQEYNFEIYAGYTFYRFYELPNITQNLNGFNVSMQYYINNWFGVDGEFASGWGSQGAYTAHSCFGGGGPRFRWAAGRGIEVWGHGMVGGSCFNLQTAYGGKAALSYQVGAGLDINAHHHRWAYRIAGDMVGTTFFNTYQYNPKISAGIVFKF